MAKAKFKRNGREAPTASTPADPAKDTEVFIREMETFAQKIARAARIGGCVMLALREQDAERDKDFALVLDLDVCAPLEEWAERIVDLTAAMRGTPSEAARAERRAYAEAHARNDADTPGLSQE